MSDYVDYEHTSYSGNVALGRSIVEYWARKTGLVVDIEIVRKLGVWCLCSNLLNGLPRRERGPVYIKKEDRTGGSLT